MQQEFQIDASRRQCNLCQRRFQPLDQYVSVLREVEAELIDQPAGQGEAAAATAAADDGQMAGSAEAQAAADDQKADDNKSEGEAVAPAAAAERPVAAKSPEAGSGLGLVREDYCPGCAPEQRGGTVAVWHSRVAPPEAAKKRRGLIIDDARLLEVFFRLAGDQDEPRLDFRYVIALMLIRKRKLKIEGTRRRAGGVRVTLVRKPRTKELHELVDRDLSDEAIIKVSQDIGDLLDLVDGQPADAEAQGGESDNAASE